MNNQGDDTVTIEVEEQLDNVFGESEETLNTSGENAEFADSPLRDLKAIALSIDWEIDDEIMTRLDDEVEKLKEEYRTDNVIVLFLRLLGSVGKYIKANKAHSHPDAVKLLNTVFINLEKVITSEDMAETDREKILLGEVKRFKRLKEEIVAGKIAAAKEKETEIPEKAEPMVVEKEGEAEIAVEEEFMAPGPEAEETGVLADERGTEISDIAQMQPHEAFAYALDEIRQVIKAEFKALKAEIKLWRDGK